jgi:hypothetical protein
MGLDSRHVARHHGLAAMLRTVWFPSGSMQIAVTYDSSSTFAYPRGPVLDPQTMSAVQSLRFVPGRPPHAGSS